MDKISEMMIKMAHIGVINMMEDKIGKNVSSFNELEKYSIVNLEELRDDLVIEYNKVMEARKFAAEMIYDRKPINHKSVPLENVKKEEMYFVNKDDWQEKFWRNNYHVWLTAQGIEFCVNADSAGDAMDFIMDFCVENNMPGLYSKERLQDDEYVTAGNFGYQFTTHNIRIEIID